MRVKFGELKIGNIAKHNIQKVIDNNWASEGPLVQEFEEKWSKKFGYADSIAMSSGTDADINACLALYDFGAKRGDEIICPALTFIATANAILAAGFLPKFVDIKRNTLNIDETKIEDAISEKTRAIMVTHTMGKPCEMDVIMDIAKRKNLFVIEDACEAHACKYKGVYTGKIGDVATFSFYTAHIVVAGEGGMCSTDNKELGQILRSTRSHGRLPGSKYFNFVRTGLNSRMNDLEAAIGLEGLHNIDETLSVRRQNRDKLLNLLADRQDMLTLFWEQPHEYVSPHAFPIVMVHDACDTTSVIYKYLESSGIECKTLFSSVPTQHKSFEFMGHKIGEFPEAEYVGRNGFHFGIHQYLTEEDIGFISDRIHSILL